MKQKKQKLVKSVNGLRFIIDKKTGKLIDQYGRIFDTDKNGNPTKVIGVGYATH